MTYVLDLEENLSRSEEGHRRTPNGHAIVHDEINVTDNNIE